MSASDAVSSTREGPGARDGRSRWVHQRDHVHMLLSIPLSLSVPRAVQCLKGRSSHKLLAEFASLRKRYWGQHLWARGYWVASSGNVTDEVWMGTGVTQATVQRPPAS